MYNKTYSIPSTQVKCKIGIKFLSQPQRHQRHTKFSNRAVWIISEKVHISASVGKKRARYHDTVSECFVNLATFEKCLKNTVNKIEGNFKFEVR